MSPKPGTAGLAGRRKIAMAGKNGIRLATVSMSMRMRPELLRQRRDLFEDMHGFSNNT